MDDGVAAMGIVGVGAAEQEGGKAPLIFAIDRIDDGAGPPQPPYMRAELGKFQKRRIVHSQRVLGQYAAAPVGGAEP